MAPCTGEIGAGTAQTLGERRPSRLMSPIVYRVDPLEQHAVEARLRTGHRVRSLREQAGQSRHELGVRTDMTRDSVAQIERGEIDVGIAELSRLAQALGAPMSALVADEASP